MSARDSARRITRPVLVGLCLLVALFLVAAASILVYQSIRSYRWADAAYARWWLRTPSESVAGYNAWRLRRIGWERTRWAMSLAVLSSIFLIISVAGTTRYRWARRVAIAIAVVFGALVAVLCARWIGRATPRPYWDG